VAENFLETANFARTNILLIYILFDLQGFSDNLHAWEFNTKNKNT